MNRQTQPCELLTWDSEFFGFRIARAWASRLTPTILRAITEWCEENHVECLYFLADSDDRDTIHLAEQNEFRLVDIRVTMTHDREGEPARRAQELPSAIHIRSAQAGDVLVLRKIAGGSHTLSRFHFDRCIPSDLSQSFYQQWIENSCQGYADKVWVAEWDGRLSGYITCHLPGNGAPARIGLLGVDPGYHGHGLGKALVNQALTWFDHEHLHPIEVVTQGRNIPAQRLYQKCGFTVRTLQLWYHRWFAACST